MPLLFDMDLTINPNLHLISSSHPVNLSDLPSTPPTGTPPDKQLKKHFKSLCRQLRQLQPLMYAQSKHALLIILQAMDAGGKDSTIRHITAPINPQNCHVLNFKSPSEAELQRDYLWRIHLHTPPKGCIAIYNRSHYEDIVTVSVRNLAPPTVWHNRYQHVNAFEQLLTDEHTHILKFFLHISKDYQKRRLQRRLDRPDKHWKFDPSDIEARAHWDNYMTAYSSVFNECSSNPDAPWYVIPAENRHYRNLMIMKIITDKLQSLNMQYPAPQLDISNIKIDD